MDEGVRLRAAGLVLDYIDTSRFPLTLPLRATSPPLLSPPILSSPPTYQSCCTLPPRDTEDISNSVHPSASSLNPSSFS